MLERGEEHLDEAVEFLSAVFVAGLRAASGSLR
jgi:hypothetical protein